MKNTPDSPKIESGLIQMILMGKSIQQMWVNHLGTLPRNSIVRLTDGSPYVPLETGYLKTHIIIM